MQIEGGFKTRRRGSQNDFTDGFILRKIHNVRCLCPVFNILKINENDDSNFQFIHVQLSIDSKDSSKADFQIKIIFQFLFLSARNKWYILKRPIIKSS